MRKILWLLVIPLLFTSCTTSKLLYSVDAMEQGPSALLAVDADQYEQQYGEYDGVILSSETVIEHACNQTSESMFGAAWKYRYITHEQYIIFNPSAEDLTTIMIPLKPDKFYVRITSPSGDMRTYDKSTLVEEDNGGDKLYKFIIPAVGRGALVDMGMEFNGSYRPASFFSRSILPPLSEEIQVLHRVPCQKVKVIFAYPDLWEIKAKRDANGQIPDWRIVTDHRNHKIIMTYEVRDTPAFASEPFSPEFEEQAINLQLKVTRLRFNGQSYPISTTWEDVVNRVWEVLLGDSDTDSELLRNATRAVTANCETDMQKLGAISRFVADSIRTDTDEDKEGNYAEILRSREGSTTDAVGLFWAMCRTAGLETHYLMVHDATSGPFDDQYVSISEIANPTVSVEVDSVKYFILPSLAGVPLDVLPWYLEGQPAVVLDESLARIVQTDISPPENNSIDETYRVTIDENGTVRVEEQKILRGSLAYSMRRKLAEADHSKTEELVKARMTFTDANIVLDTFHIENRDTYQKPLSIAINYTIDNLVMVTPQDIIFQTGGLFAPLSELAGTFMPEERLNPIAIHRNEQYHKNIEIVYPETWALSTELHEVNIENDLGSLSASYQAAGHTLTVDLEVILKRCNVPREKATDLATLVSNRSPVAIPTLVFGRKDFGTLLR